MASRPTNAARSARGGAPAASGAKAGRSGRSGTTGRSGPPVRGKGSRRAGPPPVRPQRSWGMIAATTAVALFAIGVLAFAVNSNRNAGKPVSIKGVASHTYTGGQHVKANEKVPYEVTPPDGGQHDGSQWADCTGTVYTTQIRNEDAVHSLEHGAVWITYRPDLAKGDVDKLDKLAEGKAYTMVSPYPGLDKAVSIQAWGKQLQVDSASDKRITQFIDAYRSPKGSAPEAGASCENPTFKKTPLAPLT